MTTDAKESSELKTCPFCGGAVQFTEAPISGEHEIECNVCPFISYWPVDWENDQIFKAWNKRTQKDTMTVEIEQLRAENENLTRALKNLVDLKDHKDQYGKDSLYVLRQPECWEMAREALERACALRTNQS